MAEVLSNRQRDLTVVCENIHDPHNVSAIFRSCDAVGISDLHLMYTTEPFPKLGKKSSASAKKWIEVQRHRDYRDLKEDLHSRGLTIYATHVSSGAKSIYETDWTKPSAILMGNEHRGVSDEALAIADVEITIPMLGMVESLNVSVATAVILFEALRQRRAGGNYPARPETDEWLREKLEKWVDRG